TWPGQPQQNVPTFTRLEHGVVLAVRDKAPFVLNAETDKATVLHGDKVTIPLKVERLWPDLKAPVAVTLALVPTGGQQQPANQAITVAPVTIAADKTDGSAVIDVKATAPPGTYTIVFRGSVQTQFGKDPMKKANATLVQPSSPVLLTVLPKQVANVTVAPPNATVKVGNQTEVTVKVARLHEYAGEFKVLLVLPPNTKGINAAEVTIPAGKDETKLVISLEADAPVGNQAGLLVR